MGKCILAGHPQGGKIGDGTYTGDGQATRTISLGVTPKWVLVFDTKGRTAQYIYTSSGYRPNAYYGGLAITGSPSTAVSIVDGGFAVAYVDDTYGDDICTNYSGQAYNYIYGT